MGLGANLNFYGDVSDYGWAYFVFSIFLMMFLRDTMFYWEHRMMHTPKLYPHMHHVHHLSFKVSPLSGLSIHPPFGKLGYSRKNRVGMSHTQGA